MVHKQVKKTIGGSEIAGRSDHRNITIAAKHIKTHFQFQDDTYSQDEEEDHAHDKCDNWDSRLRYWKT